MPHRDLWTLTVDDGEAMPVEFIAASDKGLRDIKFTVHGNLWYRVGERVRIRLSGDGRSAVGEGLIAEAAGDVDPDNDRTIIYALGPLQMDGPP